MRQRFSRHMILGWVGAHFVIISLILILVSLVMLAMLDSDGPLGFGSGIFAVPLLAGLLNLGLGLVLVLASCFYRRSTQENLPNSRQRQGRWVVPALSGCLIAVPLYGLTTVISLIMVVSLVNNGLIWRYNWQMPQVKLGDSRQRVEQVLGKPGWHSDCNDPYARSYSQATDLSRCQSISLYYQIQGSQQWELAYDAQDRLISKQYFQRDP